MSFATKSKDLPALPIVIENDNLEDIDIDTGKMNQREIVKYPNPYFHSNPSQYSKENLSMMSSKISLTNSHVPPIPKNKGPMTRPRSGSSNKPRPKLSTSQYVVQLDKTPLNLTPSQRLKLRKLQLNNSISNFNLPPKDSGKRFIDEESDDDEEIGEYDCVFNVPFSQPLSSLAQREKVISDNNDRKSLATDSTRSSSILSHDSFAETSSIVSCNCDDNLTGKKPSNYYDISRINKSLNTLSMDDLNISKDAQDLSLLFSRNESVQINEESRQKRKMLNNFKRIPKSMPSTPIKGSFSDLSISNNNGSSEYQLQSNPRTLNHRSISQSVIPMSTKERKHQSAPSKYYTFTRPTWLPPKPSYDRIKHHKESEDIIYRALQKEAEERNNKLNQLEKIKKLRKKDVEVWETLNFGDDKILGEKKKSRKVQEMYWRGLLENIRSRIWQKQIGNALNLDEKYCDIFFDKYDSIFIKKVNQLDSLLRNNAECVVALEQHVENSGNELYSGIKSAEINSNKHINIFLKANQNMLSVKTLYDRINHDLLDTYPDINAFQSNEVLRALTRTIVSFVIYLNETREKIDINEQTFSQLNTNYYFGGMNTLAALLYYHNRSSYATFIGLVNIYERKVPNLLLCYKSQTDRVNKQMYGRLLCESFMDIFESSFKKNLIRLYTHFNVIGLKSFEFIPDILAGLFSNLFNFELSCQIMDIYVFEDTPFLVRCLLALLKQISFKLFGTKQEVLNLLGEKHREENNNGGSKQDTSRYLNVGYDYQFVKTIEEMVL